MSNNVTIKMNNVELTGDEHDWASIRTSCACYGNDCNLDFQVYTWPSPKNNEDSLMEIEIETALRWNDRYGEASGWSWYYRAWKRVVAAFKLLFTGYIEMVGGICFRDKQHALDFAEGMKYVINKVDEEKVRLRKEEQKKFLEELKKTNKEEAV